MYLTNAKKPYLCIHLPLLHLSDGTKNGYLPHTQKRWVKQWKQQKKESIWKIERIWNALFVSHPFSFWAPVSFYWVYEVDARLTLLSLIHHSNAKHAHKNVYVTEVTISKWQSMKNEKWSLQAKPLLYPVFYIIAGKHLYTQTFNGTTMSITKQK